MWGDVRSVLPGDVPVIFVISGCLVPASGFETLTSGVSLLFWGIYRPLLVLQGVTSGQNMLTLGVLGGLKMFTSGFLTVTSGVKIAVSGVVVAWCECLKCPGLPGCRMLCWLHSRNTNQLVATALRRNASTSCSAVMSDGRMVLLKTGDRKGQNRTPEPRELCCCPLPCVLFPNRTSVSYSSVTRTSSLPMEGGDWNCPYRSARQGLPLLWRMWDSTVTYGDALACCLGR